MDLQDADCLKHLAWAVYDGVFMPGNKLALSGHHDWDRVIAGTLICLISWGQTDKEHCGPATIASFNAKWATELGQQQGLPQYKERWACTASTVPAWKSPTMQLMVTVLPWTISSHSTGGAQAAALDHAADSDEESPFPKASWCHVMRGSPKKVQLDPMWEMTKWLEACVETLGEEDVLWWPLVAPLMDAGTPGTRELTKCFLATWQWMVEVAATNFCLPAPTMLNICQLLDEELEEGDCTPWLLAYACTLQSMGEAAEGRTWCPMGMCFTLQVSPLMDTFIEEMGVELTELRIASCWSQLAVEVLLQKQDGPFADVIAYLDDLVRCILTQKAWDELVFQAPLTSPSVPHKCTHLSYILGCTVDLGGALPPLRLCMTEPSGELVGVVHGLLFKGNVLAYDPASNGVEWVPVWGTVNDLSPMGWHLPSSLAI